MIVIGWLACTAPPPEGPAAKTTAGGRPNVLLVVWDTVRADHVQALGYDRPTTPWLSTLASRGTVYEDATSPACWTAPGHASLFTGLPLRSHGVDVTHPWLDERYPTLAEALRDAGWDTFGWTGNRFVSASTNLVQGFDAVETSWHGRGRDRARAATVAKLLPNDRSTEISPGWTPNGHGPGWSRELTEVKEAAPVANQALAAWLRNRPDPTRPFFAFVNLMEAHQPLVPSQAARDAVMTPDEQATALQVDGTVFGWMAYTSGKQDYTAAELGALRATYDAAIHDLDAGTSAIAATLDQLGLLDDTIVVVVADHGELLGEHHMMSHRWALWDELVHVPLVIAGPGVPAGRVADVVSTAQLPATVLELVGLPALPGSAASLTTHRPGPAFSERRDPNPLMDPVRKAFPDLPVDQFGARLSSARTPTAKWIGSDRAPTDRLFARPGDPGEATDLAATQPEAVAAARAAFDAWAAEHPPYDPSLSAPTDGPKRTTDAERQALEALGYTE
ncbi:MAG: sulfatase [Myxococcota bacterium]